MSSCAGRARATIFSSAILKNSRRTSFSRATGRNQFPSECTVKVADGKGGIFTLFYLQFDLFGSKGMSKGRFKMKIRGIPDLEFSRNP